MFHPDYPVFVQGSLYSLLSLLTFTGRILMSPLSFLIFVIIFFLLVWLKVYQLICKNQCFGISFFSFLYLERSGGGAEREGERESQAGSKLSVQNLMWGSNP